MTVIYSSGVMLPDPVNRQNLLPLTTEQILLQQQ